MYRQYRLGSRRNGSLNTIRVYIECVSKGLDRHRARTRMTHS
jgi:hypothetical protein